MSILIGLSLTPESLEAIANGAACSVAPAAIAKMKASRAVVDSIVAKNEVVYGVTTGFGRLADTVIPADRVEELQVNLIRSHAAGVGVPLDALTTRALMALRAHTLALGWSGARPELAELLVAMLAKGVHPEIPQVGSVGASGDLAPLSHLALVMIGEGWAEYQGERMAGAEALKRAGLTPVRLKAKEGLALNNGTQFITSILALALLRAERAMDACDLVGAMTLEGLKGTPTAFDERIHAARPHPGQQFVAKRLRDFLDGSAIRESHRHGDPRVQDAYSLRCMPQIHGAARDALGYVRSVVEREMNSATDNPLIFAEQGEVLSGGNFHGAPVAQAADFLAIALADVASLIERRIERLVNPDLSDLPAFLTPDPGLRSGFMVPQITAAAIVNEMRTMAMPSSVDSISTGASREDHVSMGAWGARKAMRSVELFESELAIELLCAAQAVEFHRPLKSSPRLEAALARLRAVVPRLEEDRVPAPDIEAARRLIGETDFATLP